MHLFHAALVSFAERREIIMTLKKSEKILLEILILFAAFAVILVFLVMPEAENKIEAQSLNESLEIEYLEKQQLLKDPELDARYEAQKAIAQENYDYFYSVLNGYSIDEIVNGIAVDNQLAVTSLTIGDYENASGDFAAITGESLDVLVKSIVDVTVLGSYEDILAFMDDMNTKSTCLRMSLISISEYQDNATDTEEMVGVFRIYIYGIDVELQN